MLECWNEGLEIRRRFEVKVKKGGLMFECWNVRMFEWGLGGLGGLESLESILELELSPRTLSSLRLQLSPTT